MNTLEQLKAASTKSLFEWIAFSDFHSALEDSGIFVRVNLTKKMMRELQEARQAEGSEDALKFTASLIPRDETGVEPLTFEEFKTFLEGTDDDNSGFATWVVDQVWAKVNEYATAHFLSRTVSPKKLTTGETPANGPA